MDGMMFSLTDFPLMLSGLAFNGIICGQRELESPVD